MRQKRVQRRGFRASSVVLGRLTSRENASSEGGEQDCEPGQRSGQGQEPSNRGGGGGGSVRHELQFHLTHLMNDCAQGCDRGTYETVRRACLEVCPAARSQFDLSLSMELRSVERALRQLHGACERTAGVVHPSVRRLIVAEWESTLEERRAWIIGLVRDGAVEPEKHDRSPNCDRLRYMMGVPPTARGNCADKASGAFPGNPTMFARIPMRRGRAESGVEESA